jgi:hypothetical protein
VTTAVCVRNLKLVISAATRFARILMKTLLLNLIRWRMQSRVFFLSLLETDPNSSLKGLDLMKNRPILVMTECRENI